MLVGEILSSLDDDFKLNFILQESIENKADWGSYGYPYSNTDLKDDGYDIGYSDRSISIFLTKRE